MTSAPHSPSVAAACGPCTSSPASTTLIPSNAPATGQTSHSSGTRSSISWPPRSWSSPSVGEAEVRDPPQPLLEGDDQLAAGEMGAEATMPAGGERQVLGELAPELELVGVVELARIPIGRGQPEPHDVALLHRAAVEVDVLGDVSAVLDEQPVEPAELLDGVGDQLGMLDERPPVGLVRREVVEDVAQLAPGRVEAGQHDREAQRQHVLVRQRRTVRPRPGAGR